MTEKPLAFIQDRISTKSRHILPILCKSIKLALITASDNPPMATYHSVYRVRDGNYELSAALRLSRLCDHLYRQQRIQFAVQYSSIGFCIKDTPFVQLMNGTFHRQWKLRFKAASLPEKVKSLIGYAHYVIPETIATKRARKIITVSEDLKNYVMKTYNRDSEDIFVIHNGVDTALTQLYLTKNLATSPPVCVYIGRLHPSKGIRKVLEEFTKRRHLNIHIYIFGDGPDRFAIEKIALKDKRLHVLGHVGQNVLLSHLTKTNIFLFPTHTEGFGLSLVEAMASGHACICYDIPINREIISAAALFAKPYDSNNFVDLLEQSIFDNDLRVEIAEKAHKISKRFLWEKCAQNYIQLYSDLHQYFT